jgi:hypothetical protein
VAPLYRLQCGGEEVSDNCEHDYQNRREGWVCRLCGKTLKYWLES